MDFLKEILVSLSIVGIVAIIKWIYTWLTKYFKFLPYRPIWKEFTSKDVSIILTGRRLGHTTKISFNEVISANRIKDILKIKSDIITADDNISELNEKNIIVLGSEKVNNVSKEIMKQVSTFLKYSYTPDNNLIINNEIFKSKYEENILIKDYGLVVKTTNPFNPLKSAILFAGNHGLGTQSSVKALTTKIEASEIVKEIGSSHFYAVIESEFNIQFAKEPTKINVVRCGLLQKKSLEKPITILSKDDEARLLMLEFGANESLIEHSFEVAKLAVELGGAIENRGRDLDLDAIYYGAILHDIGRIKTNDIKHGIKGLEMVLEKKDTIIRNFFLTTDTFNKIIESIECHIVGGIKEDWIQQYSLDIPSKDYSPKSIEAKIVAISDQILHNRRDSEIIFKEAPEKDMELLANLYRISEEVLLSLFSKK